MCLIKKDKILIGPIPKKDKSDVSDHKAKNSVSDHNWHEILLHLKMQMKKGKTDGSVVSKHRKVNDSLINLITKEGERVYPMYSKMTWVWFTISDHKHMRVQCDSS